METKTTQTKTQPQNPDRKFVEAFWRRTGMGGITHPIALKFDGRQLMIVRPVRKMYSRSGSHGRWYYNLHDVDVLLYLERSNSGIYRSALSICRLPAEMCSRIADIVATLWIDGASTKDIEKALTLLQF